MRHERHDEAGRTAPAAGSRGFVVEVVVVVVVGLLITNTAAAQNGFGAPLTGSFERVEPRGPGRSNPESRDRGPARVGRERVPESTRGVLRNPSTPSTTATGTNSPGTGSPGKLHVIRRDGDEANADASSGGGSGWTTLLATGFVIGLIVVLGRLWRKHGPRLPGGLPPEAIDVLGTRSLGGRQAIHLLRVGSRLLVIGAGPEGMRTLSTIDDPVEVDMLAGLCRQPDSENPFGDTLRSWFGARIDTHEGDADTSPPRSENAQGVAPGLDSEPTLADRNAEDDLRARLSGRLGLSASHTEGATHG